MRSAPLLRFLWLRSLPALLVLPALSGLFACEEALPPAAGHLTREDPCVDQIDGWMCADSQASLCEADATVDEDDCSDGGRRCLPNLGCVTCVPGTTSCDGAARLQCRKSGDGYDEIEVCDDDLQCSQAGCLDLCARAASERSYTGCEYWPVTTANSQLGPDFVPAVVVANPQLIRVQVSLWRGGERLEKVGLAPGEVASLELPFEDELRVPYVTGQLTDEEGEPVVDMEGQPIEGLTDIRSSLVRGGAYRLTSSAPVTAHQYNPLEFRLDECPKEAAAQPLEPGQEPPEPAPCNSHTNDASLLLPTTALTGSYMVLTRPTLSMERRGKSDVPGFVTIVGTSKEPSPVEIRVTAHVAASDPDSQEPIAELEPGDTLTVELAAGDVLQLASSAVPRPCPGETSSDLSMERGEEVKIRYCDAGADYDLTGTEIESEQPVAVIAGHDCAFVPYNRWACDHLEETMFPLEAWGEEVVVTLPRRKKEAGAYRVKVVSATDGNVIVADPPLSGTAAAAWKGGKIRLDRGESYEWEADSHVVLSGTGPVGVAQFLLGQGEEPDVPGDPSMSLAVPREQFKNSYVLLSPETFSLVYLNVVTAQGSQVELDGVPIENFTPLGESGLSVARVQLTRPGIHRVDGRGPTGVVAYGYAEFTSFMVPGGLDFRLLYTAF